MSAASRRLLLLKHAAPIVTPGEPPARWPLSPAGQASLRPLAAALAAYRPTAIVASDERKARETATGLAAHLGLPAPALDHDLREHERGPDDFFPREDDFTAAVRAFFAAPDTLTFGRETATATHARFAAAVARHRNTAPPGDLVIVAHGTVISLFVAAHAGFDPFPLWQRLGLPSFVALALPEGRVVEVVERVGSA
jgi:2,3-bisphosphoglycerate-dependent phosphoglycerate mutase